MQPRTHGRSATSPGPGHGSMSKRKRVDTGDEDWTLSSDESEPSIGTPSKPRRVTPSLAAAGGKGTTAGRPPLKRPRLRAPAPPYFGRGLAQPGEDVCNLIQGFLNPFDLASLQATNSAWRGIGGPSGRGEFLWRGWLESLTPAPPIGKEFMVPFVGRLGWRGAFCSLVNPFCVGCGERTDRFHILAGRLCSDCFMTDLYALSSVSYAQAHLLLPASAFAEDGRIPTIIVQDPQETGLIAGSNTKVRLCMWGTALVAAFQRWGGREGLAAEISRRRARAQRKYKKRKADSTATSPSLPRILREDEMNFPAQNQFLGRLSTPKYGRFMFATEYSFGSPYQVPDIIIGDEEDAPEPKAPPSSSAQALSPAASPSLGISLSASPAVGAATGDGEHKGEAIPEDEEVLPSMSPASGGGSDGKEPEEFGEEACCLVCGSWHGSAPLDPLVEAKAPVRVKTLERALQLSQARARRGVTSPSILLTKDVKWPKRKTCIEITHPLRIRGAEGADNRYNKYTLNVGKATMVAFAGLMVDNIRLVSGAKPNRPPWHTKAFPCLQMAADFDLFVRDCIVSGYNGTGILIQRGRALIERNLISYCGYAGICVLDDVPTLPVVRYNEIVECGTWPFQYDGDLPKPDDFYRLNVCNGNEKMFENFDYFDLEADAAYEEERANSDDSDEEWPFDDFF